MQSARFKILSEIYSSKCVPAYPRANIYPGQAKAGAPKLSREGGIPCLGLVVQGTLGVVPIIGFTHTGRPRYDISNTNRIKHEIWGLN